jgi:choline dehydrogenase-like flavoprotein
MTWSEAGAFLRSSPEQEIPDLQFHAALGIVQEEGLSSGHEQGLGFGPYVCRPVATGSVQLRSNVPYAKPRIRHNYFGEPADRDTLRQGLRMAMEIARQPALRERLETLEEAGAAGLAPRSDTDEAIDEYIRGNAFSFYHPSGSCAMGRVVDSRLRVQGLANVRVADTSVMPTELTGNLNAPAIMIGERVADFILGSSTDRANTSPDLRHAVR